MHKWKPANFVFANDKIRMTVNNRYEIKIPPLLVERLGFPEFKDRWIGSNTEGYTSYNVTIHSFSPIHTFNVMTDIVDDQIVGNKMMPLLRSVPNTGPIDEWTTEDISDEHYVPVNVRYLNSIEMKVCFNDTPILLPYESEFSCTLHFQQFL